MSAPAIPALSGLPSAPKRIILHWTGGAKSANGMDRQHYHYIINQDGTIVAGVHPVAANLKAQLANGAYAAHTGGYNTGSVGVSFAGMLNAVRGGSFGPAPLTASQVAAGLRFVTQLCDKWQIEPTHKRLFTHMEAWTLHGVKGVQNDKKWDIAALQFRPDLGEADVGPWLRDEVRRLQNAGG
ncbi:MAG TPA: peptidoglycan recognition family protein [Longimicrobiaceae bacterium]|nr:peptidoglycan recognition family protein [Longimicrobiaceae bacterium]